MLVNAKSELLYSQSFQLGHAGEQAVRNSLQLVAVHASETIHTGTINGRAETIHTGTVNGLAEIIHTGTINGLAETIHTGTINRLAEIIHTGTINGLAETHHTGTLNIVRLKQSINRY